MRSHFYFDGHYMLYRSAWSHAKDQSPTWGPEVLAHVIGMMRVALLKYRPDTAFVVWDGGRSQRRREIHPQYKKTEKRKNHEEFVPQMRSSVVRLTAVLRKMGCRVLSLPNRESDDVIAFLVRELGGGTVVSEDKDFYQLVDHGADVYRPFSDQYLSRHFFANEFHGIQPHQYLLARACAGDTSDNIDGVKGIGFKTISKILAEMPQVRTVDELLMAIPRLAKKGQKVTSIVVHQDLVRRNLELIDSSKEILSDLEIEAVRASIGRMTVFDDSVTADLEQFGLAQVDPNVFPSWSVPFRRLS